MSYRSAIIATAMLVSGIGAGSAMADVGDLRASVGYSTMDSSYGGFADAAQRDRYMITARGTYTYTDDLKIGVSFGFGESETDRNSPAFADTDVEAYGINARYRVNDSWSAFGAVGYTKLDTDGVDPFATPFSVEGDGYSYIAGAAYDKEVSENAFFILSGSIAYSEIDTDDFSSGIPGEERSVTTWNITPEFGVVLGDYTITAGASYIQSNRDFRFVNDTNRVDAGLGVSYDFGNDWYLSGRVQRSFADQATSTIRYNLNLTKTINLL